MIVWYHLIASPISWILLIEEYQTFLGLVDFRPGMGLEQNLEKHIKLGSWKITSQDDAVSGNHITKCWLWQLHITLPSWISNPHPWRLPWKPWFLWRGFWEPHHIWETISGSWMWCVFCGKSKNLDQSPKSIFPQDCDAFSGNCTIFSLVWTRLFANTSSYQPCRQKKMLTNHISTSWDNFFPRYPSLNIPSYFSSTLSVNMVDIFSRTQIHAQHTSWSSTCSSSPNWACFCAAGAQELTSIHTFCFFFMCQW